MKTLFQTIGIGVLIGFGIPFLIFSLLNIIFGGEFEPFYVSLMLFYSTVGGLFGTIGTLIGKYRLRKEGRRVWISGLAATGIFFVLFFLLLFTIPCPMLGGC